MKKIKKEDAIDAVTVVCLTCLGILIILNAMNYINKITELETQYKEQTEILKKDNEDLKNQIEFMEFEHDAEMASLTNAIENVDDKLNNKIKEDEEKQQSTEDIDEVENTPHLTLQNTETTEEVPPIIAAATRVDDGEEVFAEPSIIYETTEETYDKFIEVDEEELVEEQPVIDNSPSYTYLGSYSLTAYEWTGNPCANGNYPTKWYTVACNSLSLGTRIYIEGYGEFVVEDRGGMNGSTIDVYLGDYNECIQFGRRSADVYIVN